MRGPRVSNALTSLRRCSLSHGALHRSYRSAAVRLVIAPVPSRVRLVGGGMRGIEPAGKGRELFCSLERSLS
jgi:hypothetical protein